MKWRDVEINVIRDMEFGRDEIKNGRYKEAELLFFDAVMGAIELKSEYPKRGIYLHKRAMTLWEWARQLRLSSQEDTP